MVVRALTFARGIYVGDGMAWEAVRQGFWGVGHGCFFGLKLLEVFVDEDFVERVGLVGLDNFWAACDFFGCESLGEGDGVFVRSGAVGGSGVML